jgi:hypothetical protein
VIAAAIPDAMLLPTDECFAHANCFVFFVVSYSQCNVLTGHHCVLEIIWSVISYHLSFQKNIGVLNFFLCVYIVIAKMAAINY